MTDAPFALPLKLGRRGLSEVINHLLELSDEDSQPFDFLINDVLLRSSLLKFTQQYKISTENILVIDYIPALALSDESQAAETPAWISCIDTATVDQSVFFVGCYDGQVQIPSKETLAVQTKYSFQAHSEPIRAIQYLNSSSNSDTNRKDLIATASKVHIYLSIPPFYFSTSFS